MKLTFLNAFKHKTAHFGLRGDVRDQELPHDHFHDTQLTCGLFHIERVDVTRLLGGCHTYKPNKEEYPQVRWVSSRKIKLEADSRVSGTNNDGAKNAF